MRGSKEIWLRDLSQSYRKISLINGFPSPHALQIVGLRYQIGVHDLLRNLQFPGQFPGFHVNPGLPSERKVSFSIRLTSLGHSSRDLYNDERSLTAAQRDIQDNMEEHIRGSLGSVTVGRDCYRKVTIHGRNHFSVEQQVTVAILFTNPEEWTALILNDCGIPTNRPPWLIGSTSSDEISFYPIDEHRFLAVDGSRLKSDKKSENLPGNQPNPFKSRSCLGQQLSEEERQIMREDPFHVVCNILRTAAMSWAQLLDFIGEPESSRKKDDESTLTLIQQNKQFVEAASRHFDEILRFLEHRGETEWPRLNLLSTTSVLAQRASEEAESLRRDLASLKERARQISLQCSDTTNTILSISNVDEARRAVLQGHKLEQLTILAFLFIPLNFLSSCFGMNVTELGEQGPSVRIFLAVAIPLTGLFMVIPLWSRIFLTALSVYRRLSGR